MKKICLILFFTLGTAVWATSLEEAWEVMQQNSDSQKALQKTLQIAKSKKSSAKSMYLPSLSLTGSYTHLSDPVKIEDKIDLPLNLGVVPFRLDLSKQDVFMANLHALWPLYTGGKIDAAQDIYAAGVDEANALKEMKKDKEFLELVKLYYGVVVTKSLYETMRQSQKALREHYENAKKLYENAQIANVELLHAKVKLDNAQIAATKAKHAYEIALEALQKMTDASVTPTEELFVGTNEEEASRYEQATQEHAASLKILDAKAKQSQALTKIKTSSWFPTVVGYANYNLYKDDSIIAKSLPTWFAGVVVKIDLLKRKDRNEEIQSAKMLQDKVRYLKADARKKLSILVDKTYKEMMSAKEEYEALRSSIALAKENFRLRRISFKEGLSTSVELTEAEALVLGAQTKRLKAAYDYVQKLAQLCVLAGEREKFFEFVQQGEKK